MEKTERKALVIVDAQRGFMPASEGDRLEMPGFGALGVAGGEKIVPRINKLTRAFYRSLYPIATTQDWHPEQTAHFSDEPNFIDTWPKHCVAGTPGADLHPDLLVAQRTAGVTNFIKGTEPCASPQEDNSYSGALAYEHYTGLYLPDWLHQSGADHVYTVGLALGDGDEHKLCVDSTAVDLQDLGFDVTLVTDATEAVLPENREKCLRNLARRGIRLMTTAEVLEEIGHESA